MSGFAALFLSLCLVTCLLLASRNLMHTLAYHQTTAAGPVTNLDMTAVNDVIIGVRNSHFIFTDTFLCNYAYALSKTITAMRVNDPTLNAFFRHQLWPLDTGAIALSTIPDRPALISYRAAPIQIPVNEEFALEWTETGAAEDAVALLWLFTPDHNWTIPMPTAPGQLNGIRLTLDATYAITPAATYTWTGGSAFTFSQTLRGGWYQVNGLNVFDAGVIAARLIFPRGRNYDGRILRPGCLAQQVVGNRPDPAFMGGVGVWGYFHSFEPVQIEIFSTTAGAHAGDCKLDLTFLGSTPPSGYSTAGGV